MTVDVRGKLGIDIRALPPATTLRGLVEVGMRSVASAPSNDRELDARA